MFKPFLKRDVIASIEKVSVVGISKEWIWSLIKSYMRNGKGVIHCRVFANNIYHQMYSQFNTMHQTLCQTVQSELTFSAPNQKFFRTRVIRLYNPEAKEMATHYVVWHVWPKVMCNTGMIFFGDVIMQVNGRPISILSESDVQRLWAGRSSVDVIVLSVSVLRRKDLQEAAQELNDVLAMKIKKVISL
ncbi:hypothetical protein BIW11_02986 [Tropilaelaps mercedesae]|uniref:PDZ domain-containing protein n=1 Tax=Tropilaelaps mercedesae TaxID=418985 RepID=A0A1V9XU07_9ACAR|nr:hypothetical protein BIW11_02986 [Tropilaelaps mercedesae]